MTRLLRRLATLLACALLANGSMAGMWLMCAGQRSADAPVAMHHGTGASGEDCGATHSSGPGGHDCLAMTTCSPVVALAPVTGASIAQRPGDTPAWAVARHRSTVSAPEPPPPRA